MDTDTSSAGDGLGRALMNVWRFALGDVSAKNSHFTSSPLSSQGPSMSRTTSVLIDKTELEWDVPGEISDVTDETMEGSLFDDADEGLFEYDLAVQMPPKDRYKVHVIITSVRKGKPPKVDPSWLL